MGEQINARDWIFEVQTAALPTPTYAEVDGLESFTLNPGEGEETADTTTFNSNGNSESQVMQRGAALTLAGKHVVTAGVQDPGQVAVEELAAEVGQASLGVVRFRHTSQTEWTVWNAHASLAEKGGATNDKSSWGATFTRSGAATTAPLV